MKRVWKYLYNKIIELDDKLKLLLKPLIYVVWYDCTRTVLQLPEVVAYCMKFESSVKIDFMVNILKCDSKVEHCWLKSDNTKKRSVIYRTEFKKK